MDEREFTWRFAELVNEAIDSGMAPEDVRNSAEGYIEGRMWEDQEDA